MRNERKNLLQKIRRHKQGINKTYRSLIPFNKVEYMKLWRQNNRETVNAYGRKQRKTFGWQEKHNIYCRIRYKNNPELKEKSRIYILKRRRINPLIVKASTYRLPIKIIQQIYEDNIKKYGTLTCYLCLKPILFGDDNLEHKIPLSRGGVTAYNNLDIAHSICNKKKFNKTDIEYKKEMCNGTI